MKATIFMLLRSVAAVVVGAVVVLTVVFGTVWLLLPGWMQESGFPTSASGLALLVGIEAAGGLAGALVASLLAPRAPTAHGWALGGLVLGLNILTVTDPGTSWPFAPAVLLVGLVPLQTWVGIALALRIRGRSDAPQDSTVAIPRNQPVE